MTTMKKLRSPIDPAQAIGCSGYAARGTQRIASNAVEARSTDDVSLVPAHAIWMSMVRFLTATDRESLPDDEHDAGSPPRSPTPRGPRPSPATGPPTPTTGSAPTRSAPPAPSPCATAASSTTSASAGPTLEPKSCCWPRTCTSASSTPPPANCSANSPSTPPATTSPPAARQTQNQEHRDPTWVHGVLDVLRDHRLRLPRFEPATCHRWKQPLTSVYAARGKFLGLSLTVTDGGCHWGRVTARPKRALKLRLVPSAGPLASSGVFWMRRRASSVVGGLDQPP